MKTFREFITEKVSQEDMIEALYVGIDDDKFTQDMYDWLQDNYPDASIYGGDDSIYNGDATPDEFLELLDKKSNIKIITKLYKAMLKKHKKVMLNGELVL